MMNKATVIACVHNDTNTVVGVLKESPSYTGKLYEVDNKFTGRTVINEYNNPIYDSVEELINHIWEEDELDRSTFNSYTQHFELRDIEFIPHTDNPVKLVKYYLEKLKDISETYMNPFVNDAGGSTDFRQLNNVINDQLKYFNEIYK